MDWINTKLNKRYANYLILNNYQVDIRIDPFSTRTPKFEGIVIIREYILNGENTTFKKKFRKGNLSPVCLSVLGI